MTKPLALAAILLLSGCAVASIPWTQAHCLFYFHNGYRVASCDDDYVGRICRQRGKLADNGKPIDYFPRACENGAAIYWRDVKKQDDSKLGGGRAKAAILIGRSYMDCLDHEICHTENPLTPEMCEQKYPCRGDRP